MSYSIWRFTANIGFLLYSNCCFIVWGGYWNVQMMVRRHFCLDLLYRYVKEWYDSPYFIAYKNNHSLLCLLHRPIPVCILPLLANSSLCLKFVRDWPGLLVWEVVCLLISRIVISLCWALISYFVTLVFIDNIFIKAVSKTLIISKCCLLDQCVWLII